MGVKNLWDLLESCKKTLPLHHLQNKRVCVDLSCWLIQFHYASKSNFVEEKHHLKLLFHRVRALIALNCDLIFVTDGAIPFIKLSTYRRRLGSVPETIHENKSSQSTTSLRRNMASEFSCMIKEAKVLGLALGIPFLDGIEEAEAQCALLNSESLCDGCFTSDSDIFLFGARTVYREIVLGEGGHVICYDMADVEQRLGFGRNSLIMLAILLGSDYSQGVYGFGPETASQLVKSIGDDHILQKVKLEGLSFAKKISKGSKKNVNSLNCNTNKENLICYNNQMAENEKKLGPNEEVLQIINAYLKPKCHLPYSEAVFRACTTYPFLREKLQQLCSESFGWSPQKTDEYILPKIAERDLRRFANLRRTSSELGADIPLQKMPVPCPVAAIIKPRKLHGIECFEVSWQDTDVLQTSIVPAGLVESACPEKLAEFMEKKNNMMKKRNTKGRSKKDTRIDFDGVDIQLSALQLDVESQSNSLPSASQLLPTAATKAIRSEVIDLSSPSPPLRARKVPKAHKMIDEQMNMIDLCESDTEVSSSPEHRRKARELRLFIESIREEL